MENPCIIPISAPDALQWAAGAVSCAHLVMRADLSPEAVFVANLPDLAAYRVAIRQLRVWHLRGAVCMVFQTSNETLARAMVKRGAIATLAVTRGSQTGHRYLMPPPAFSAWLFGTTGRMAQNSAATTGVTSSR